MGLLAYYQVGVLRWDNGPTEVTVLRSGLSCGMAGASMSPYEARQKQVEQIVEAEAKQRVREIQQKMGIPVYDEVTLTAEQADQVLNGFALLKPKVRVPPLQSTPHDTPAEPVQESWRDRPPLI